MLVHPAIGGVVGLVLLFDIYTLYQQSQIVRIRHQVLAQEKLFRLITENAGDMIAVVDINGHRLYNSPSYQKILGYSPEELQETSAHEQIHPEDLALVHDAAKEAQQTGFGRRIEYRMRHKDGTWRYLESTASAIRDDNGDSPRAGAFESYGRTPQRSRPAPVAARASANSDASNLSGYSARPEGMCWERTGAGGHELNGHWAKCRSH